MWTSSADADLNLLQTQMDRLARDATAQLEADGVPTENISLERSVDCRYVGQGYELRVPAPDGDIDDVWVKTVAEAFHEAHGRTYSQRFDDKPVQLINIRVTGVGAVPHVRITEIEKGTADCSAAIKTVTRALFWRDDTAAPEWIDTPVYDRSLLLAGNTIDGPAIVEQFDSTTIIGMNQHATVDAVGHIIIERKPA